MMTEERIKELAKYTVDNIVGWSLSEQERRIANLIRTIAAEARKEGAEKAEAERDKIQKEWNAWVEKNAQWIGERAVILERNQRLQERLRGLEEALWQHREDLHGYSTRPCGTCRKSAEVLGIVDIVPNSCADRFADKKARQALQTKEEKR